MQRVIAALLAAAASVAVVLVAAAPSGAAGPYPDLGSCSVFPDPPAGLSPRAKSLPTQAAWNQDVSKAPRAKNSAAVIGYIESHGGGNIHPDFGSPRLYGFPYAVVDSGQPQLPISYTAYGAESSPGPFPLPASTGLVEGGNGSDGDRHVLVVDRGECKLYELYRGFYEPSPNPHWNAESGVAWDLRSAATWHEGWTSADAAGLPIFPGLARYGLIVADNGSNWYISGSSDSRWDDGNLNQLKRIPGSAFEVVASAASVHPC